MAASGRPQGRLPECGCFWPPLRRLWQQRQESGRISLPLLAESFTPDEVSHLSTIVQKPESLKNAPQALRDYIRIIQEEYQKRSGAGLNPLAAATEKYKAQLGHGGKQHG